MLEYMLENECTTTIMELVRHEHAGRGHRASYARFHRLVTRGLAAQTDAGPRITDAGRSAVQS